MGRCDICMTRPSRTFWSWRRGHKGYEEVRVPAIATAQPGPGEKMVLIEDLPEWAQLPFDGYKCVPLPHVQLAALPAATCPYALSSSPTSTAVCQACSQDCCVRSLNAR